MDITIRDWIEATLQLSGATCEIHKKSKLELVWFGEEEDPDLWYIRCPKCNREYEICVIFQYKEIQEKPVRGP